MQESTAPPDVEARPMPLYQAAIAFAATSSAFFGFLYILLPLLRQKNFSWFVCFNLTLAVPMFLLVLSAVLAFVLEGHQLCWRQFLDRYRLSGMDSSSWFWTLGLSIFMIGGQYASLLAFASATVAAWLDHRKPVGARLKVCLGVTGFLALTWALWQTRPFLGSIALHVLPSTLQDFVAHLTDPHSFMGVSLHHRWWVAAYYAFVLLAGNIAGEELWWRGYLLPRQEAASGSMAWIYHGVLWAAFHLFLQTTAWDLVRMVPTCCALAFVAYHRKNTWPGVIAHTAGNSGILIGIIHGIAN